MDLAKACSHLTNLSLTQFKGAFDLNSCHIIASFLEDKSCMLRKLDLSHNFINDEGCRVIAESLRINRRLRWIDMSAIEAFSKGMIPVICDISSIESTHDSNHTLISVETYGSIYRAPSDLPKLLEINRHEDKIVVAKLKVLRWHFNSDFDLTAVASLGLTAMPCLLGWFGGLVNSKSTNLKDEQSCLSALYRIIRHKPELCGYPGYERMERLKAENQVTTLTLHNEELLRELNAARSRIEALIQEMKTMRG